MAKATSDQPGFTVGEQLLGKLGRREFGRLLDNLIKLTRKGKGK